MFTRFVLLTCPVCILAVVYKGAGIHDGEKLLSKLQDRYLNTVRMGLLGGLNHYASTDPNQGATTDYNKRNECLAKDWTTGAVLDNCIMKWDANERLLRVQDLYKKVLHQGIPGDLMECGVWRGGVTVYMAALLQAHDDASRNVWVSDSFNGVPNALRQAEGSSYDIPDDVKDMDERQWGGSVNERGVSGQREDKNILTVEQVYVRDNFKRFDLLNEKVKFVPGYFNETLPFVSKKGLEHLAILRVDGDLYSSTMDVLQNLYDKVSPGGFIIFDDYPLFQSRRAIEDFFKSRHLDLKLIKTDRMTPEDRSFGEADINMNAYFQKPK